MKDIIMVLVLSVAPISELRGAIPYGVSQGIHPLEATLIAVLGNALIVPILYFVLRPVFTFLKGFEPIKDLVHAYERRAESKIKSYEKYRFLGLVLLVGIPLPTTGVYTGVVASHVLGMPAKSSIAANIIGVCISGTIVFLLTSGVLKFF
ncbi:MAG: small multi-drug export protein [Bacillota bacterium]|nr:small multi-drug export protein [Bacillota bacterium]